MLDSNTPRAGEGDSHQNQTHGLTTGCPSNPVTQCGARTNPAAQEIQSSRIRKALELWFKV